MTQQITNSLFTLLGFATPIGPAVLAASIMFTVITTFWSVMEELDKIDLPIDALHALNALNVGLALMSIFMNVLGNLNAGGIPLGLMLQPLLVGMALSLHSIISIEIMNTMLIIQEKHVRRNRNPNQ